MTEPVPVWVVAGDPISAARSLAPDRAVVERLPPAASGYDLRAARLVWPVLVGDDEACARVLHAVQRGVAVVVRVDGLPRDVADRFVEELHRATGAPVRQLRTACELREDQVRLLRALARGATVASAASELGMGLRSASRRLAEARRTLGVETTAEAVRLLTERSRST